MSKYRIVPDEAAALGRNQQNELSQDEISAEDAHREHTSSTPICLCEHRKSKSKWVITKDTTQIGSDPTLCDIVLTDKSVKPRHATISRDVNGMFLMYGSSDTYLLLSAHLGGRYRWRLRTGQILYVGDVRVVIEELITTPQHAFDQGNEINLEHNNAANENDSDDENSVSISETKDIISENNLDENLDNSNENNENGGKTPTKARKTVHFGEAYYDTGEVVQLPELQPTEDNKADHIYELFIRIRIDSGFMKGKVIQVSSFEPVLVGTAASNEIILLSKKVSNLHCKIEVDDRGSCFLTDLAFNNSFGTRVVLQRATGLCPGDMVMIGTRCLEVMSWEDAGISEKWDKICLKVSRIRNSDSVPLMNQPLAQYFAVSSQFGCIIGKGKNADIRVRDMSLAKYHSHINASGGRFFLEGLIDNKKRGSYVLLGRQKEEDDGAWQEKPVELDVGMSFKMGGSVFQVVEMRLENNRSIKETQQLLRRRIATLQQVPLFANIKYEELERIARICRQICYEAGCVVFQEGQIGTDFFIIESGHAVITLSHVANNSALTLGPGNYFGEISLTTGTPRSATVRASTELNCLLLSKSDFITLFNPRIHALLRLRLFEEERTKRVRLLQMVPLFRILPHEALEMAAASLVMRSYGHKQKILRKNAHPKHFYIIVQGQVFVGPHGTMDECTLEGPCDVLEAGQCFGHMAILCNRRCAHNFWAHQQVTCMVMSLSQFKWLSGDLKRIAEPTLSKFAKNRSNLRQQFSKMEVEFFTEALPPALMAYVQALANLQMKKESENFDTLSEATNSNDDEIVETELSEPSQPEPDEYERSPVRHLKEHSNWAELPSSSILDDEPASASVTISSSPVMGPPPISNTPIRGGIEDVPMPPSDTSEASPVLNSTSSSNIGKNSEDKPITPITCFAPPAITPGVNKHVNNNNNNNNTDRNMLESGTPLGPNEDSNEENDINSQISKNSSIRTLSNRNVRSLRSIRNIDAPLIKPPPNIPGNFTSSLGVIHLINSPKFRTKYIMRQMHERQQRQAGLSILQCSMTFLEPWVEKSLKLRLLYSQRLSHMSRKETLKKQKLFMAPSHGLDIYDPIENEMSDPYMLVQDDDVYDDVGDFDSDESIVMGQESVRPRRNSTIVRQLSDTDIQQRNHYIKFRVVAGPLGQIEFTFISNFITIGSDSNNTIKINDSSLSPLHGFIEYKNGKYYLYDAHSETGTFLKLAHGSKYLLQLGTTFMIGNSEFRVMGKVGDVSSPNSKCSIA